MGKNLINNLLLHLQIPRVKHRKGGGIMKKPVIIHPSSVKPNLDPLTTNRPC
ncbi:hypothetical protein D3C76_1578110 [compost metagenome]